MSSTSLSSAVPYFHHPMGSPPRWGTTIDQRDRHPASTSSLSMYAYLNRESVQQYLAYEDCLLLIGLAGRDFGSISSEFSLSGLCRPQLPSC
jgi:hypothetical protein